MMKSFAAAVLALSLVGLGACAEDATTPAAETFPLDGDWKVTSLTCDGTDQVIGDFTLKVNGTTGQFIQGFGPECVLTLEETYAYPTSTTFSITPTAIACNPNTACPPPLDACQLPPATSFEFVVNGSTATFTKTAEGPGDAPCTPGQAMEFGLTAL